MKTLLSLLLLLPLFSSAEDGLATYYTEESCKREGTSGIYTANGERFDEKALTCARRSRTWGAKFKVTALHTDKNGKTTEGKSIIVRQNDFGPGKKPAARGVIIDLTPAGMKALGAWDKGWKGEIKVRVEEIK